MRLNPYLCHIFCTFLKKIYEMEIYLKNKYSSYNKRGNSIERYRSAIPNISRKMYVTRLKLQTIWHESTRYSSEVWSRALRASELQTPISQPIMVRFWWEFQFWNPLITGFNISTHSLRSEHFEIFRKFSKTKIWLWAKKEHNFLRILVVVSCLYDQY